MILNNKEVMFDKIVFARKAEKTKQGVDYFAVCELLSSSSGGREARCS